MMFSGVTPELQPFQIFLSESGRIDKIYEALGKEDLSEVVVAAMDVLKSTTDIEIKVETKSEIKSNTFRNEGNQFYAAQSFRAALESYNQALLYAPDNSQAMKLAYSNRSALLFTVKAYTACINDIETFFSMGCTDFKLVQRLKHRKSECLRYVWMENMPLGLGAFGEKFFKLDSKRRHHQIPCATTDVSVVLESGLPKLVAANDIPVGRLVALESPFVSALDVDNCRVSCHYCNKLSLNLIPCDSCCIALFCNEECKNKCNKEYHNIECKIVNLYSSYTDGPASTMALRAALKMRQMCKSWKELVAESHNVGEDRTRTSSVGEIYDVKSKFSLLCSNNSSHFVHGERYNQSFKIAKVLHALANLPGYFPQDVEEKHAVIQAFARIMMHLYTSYRKIETINAAKDVECGNITTNTESNFGWYSFAGKLKHNCDANLLIMGIKNQIALLAIRPVQKGEELTISYLGHYCENIHTNRQYRLFCFTQQVCTCQVCVEKWSSNNFRKMKLSINQKAAYKNWASFVGIEGRDEKVFKATCEGVAGMKGAECTSEYHDMYREFRKITTLCQFAASDNEFVQKDD